MGAFGATLISSLLLAAAASAAPAETYPDPPEILFQDLFVAVQTLHVFPDGKDFVDAIPKSAPEDILAQYHAQKPATVAALKAFVADHFILPSAAIAETAASQAVPIDEHIDTLWTELTRETKVVPRYSSALPLPEPYVVPGGRFREIYYWDSYFTMLGLAESGRSDLIDSMVHDFAYMIDTYGHIPNGARSYYLSRSQPPFFFEMVGLLSAGDPAQAYVRYLAQLRREYRFWMQGEQGLQPGAAQRRVVALADGSILNRYWDDRDSAREESYDQDTRLASATRRPANLVYRDIRAAAESGWDFGSRWFANPKDRTTIDTTEIVPIDLNSLLYGLESAIQAGCERQGDAACVREFETRAAARRAAIDRYLWNAAAGSYLDYRWTRRTSVPRLSAATLYPLFVEVASPAQAAAVARTVARRLLQPGGIVTTPLDTGQQWDAPNGWAPLQWIAVAGFRQYAENALAETTACRWMANVSAVYRQSRKLVEKYDVVHTNRKGGGGEYPTQDGFGWTNGVMRKLEALYPRDAKVATGSACPRPPG
jgi:alpha,alpha-trehalase